MGTLAGERLLKKSLVMNMKPQLATHVPLETGKLILVDYKLLYSRNCVLLTCLAQAPSIDRA